jgi:Fe-S-cluster-containing dehydrogenase component
MQKGFVFDVNKCTGCSACRIACMIENDLEPGLTWRAVNTFNPSHIPGIPVFHLSLACNHCVDAPCLTNCPASAYTKNPVTGAVILDPRACIGCKYCSWACPFDAPRFNRSTGVVEKCTLCNERLEIGRDPACVSLCPTGALALCDITPTEKRDVLGFPKTNVKTGIEFVPLDPKRHVPEMAIGGEAPVHRAVVKTSARGPGSKITLGSEWALIVFTQIIAWLAGYAASVLVGGSGVNALVFGVLGIASLAVSGLHLGRRERALRAALNWRNSWLSREVILTTLFLGLGWVWLAMNPGNLAFGIVTAVMGFVALFCIDRVYGVTRTRGLNIHSAQTLVTGVYAAGLFAWNGELLVVMGGIKLLMYGMRKHRFYSDGQNTRILTSALRILLGIIVPVGVWIGYPEGRETFALAAAVMGEAIDRCEYYAELDIPTPRHQMITDAGEYDAAARHDGLALSDSR